MPPDPIALGEGDWEVVCGAIENSWPGGTVPRCDDRRVFRGTLARRSSVRDRRTRRMLAWRIDLCNEVSREILVEPSFLVAPDVASWAAHSLSVLTFVVGGACAFSTCRCSGLAGAQVGGRRVVLGRSPVPPVHAGCGCFLVPMVGSNPSVAARLRAALANPAGCSLP